MHPFLKPIYLFLKNNAELQKQGMDVETHPSGRKKTILLSFEDEKKASLSYDTKGVLSFSLSANSLYEGDKEMEQLSLCLEKELKNYKEPSFSLQLKDRNISLEKGSWQLKMLYELRYAF